MGKSKFLFGAILGATAAALLTPIAGRRARKKVLDAAKSVGIDKAKIDQAVGKIVEKGGEVLESAREAVEKRDNQRKSGDKTKTKSK